MKKYKVIRKKYIEDEILKQKLLRELYEAGEKEVIASVPDIIVEYPLFTEEGLVFDVERAHLSTCKVCEIKYMPSGIYYGDNDPGVYNPRNSNMEDKNIKVPPYGGYYYLQPIQDGEIGEINRKHAAKKLAAYNKWFKNLRWWVKDEKGGEDEAMKIIKRIFNEN